MVGCKLCARQGVQTGKTGCETEGGHGPRAGYADREAETDEDTRAEDRAETEQDRPAKAYCAIHFAFGF